MNKIELAIVFLLLGITSVIAPIIIVVGILVHLYSVFIAYKLYGVFGGLVTLFLPVLSEIFLFIKAATIYPIPQNLYCLALIGYVVLVLFLGLLASVATWLEGREDAKESQKRTLELREELIRQYQDQQKALESNKD